MNIKVTEHLVLKKKKQREVFYSKRKVNLKIRE